VVAVLQVSTLPVSEIHQRDPIPKDPMRGRRSNEAEAGSLAAVTEHDPIEHELIRTGTAA